MILVDREIKEAIKVGAICIDPFNEKQLNNASYDLTLDKYFAPFKKAKANTVGYLYEGDQNSHIMYKEVECERYNLAPQERILACTREFAGSTGKGYRESLRNPGKQTTIQTYLQATSTAARFGLSACLCAGWGDVGYFNKWTLEIYNFSPYVIRLQYGLVIAQLVFEEVEMPDKMYGKDLGSYQESLDLETLKKNWSIKNNMLPKRAKVMP
jgi:dCTP deaminase